MKISFQTLDTNDDIGNVYKLNPSQERFWTSPKKVVLFSGGFGCIAGETKVYDAERKEYRRVDTIDESFYVLTKSGKKALSLPPVKYGKKSLYRISFSNGKEIVVTLNHRFYTCNGWKELRHIGIGEPLFESSPSLALTIEESFLSILFSGVLRFLKRVQDYRFGYRSLFRFYDERPLVAQDAFQDTVPLQDDVLEHTLTRWQKDARALREYIPIYRLFSRPSKKDSSRLSALLEEGGEDYISEEVSEHTFEKFRFSRKSLLKRILRKIVVKFYSPYANPTITVKNIQFEKVDNYYDLHVIGNHNYLAEGVFNHNCGKSLMMVFKAMDLSLKYPGNMILMGRKTYVELNDSLIKEFFTLVPDGLIKQYYKAERRVELHNKSEIIFRHLDKMVATEIRSMNLGAAFIDQAEDISKDVFLAIKGRLRRDCVGDGDRRIYMSMNPELTWHFADFKQNLDPDYELIEASTLENEKNLPAEYIADLKKYPEAYYKQYVLGIWDESLLAGNVVFDPEHIEYMQTTVMDPIEIKEGLQIYRKFITGHTYQTGIDVAEGADEGIDVKKDNSAITIVDLTTLEEVAHWAGQLPPDVVGEKAAKFVGWYQDKNSINTVFPEMNAIGLALVNKLREFPEIHIHRREEYDKTVGKKVKRLGWRTTRQTKPLLISNFQERLRKQKPRVRTKETIAEYKTFIYTGNTKKSGMGAKERFHDDRIISQLLAFFTPGEIHDAKVLHSESQNGKIVDIQPTLLIRHGKARFSHLEKREGVLNWKTL